MSNIMEIKYIKKVINIVIRPNKYLINIKMIVIVN